MLKSYFWTKEHDGTKEMDGLAGTIAIIIITFSYIFGGFKNIEYYIPLQMVFLYNSGYTLAKKKCNLFENKKIDFAVFYDGIEIYIIYPTFFSGVLCIISIILSNSTISLNEITRNIFMIYLFRPVSVLMGMGLAYLVSKAFIYIIFNRFGLKKCIVICLLFCTVLQIFRLIDLSGVTYLLDKKFTNYIVSYILGFIFYFMLQHLRNKKTYHKNVIVFILIFVLLIVALNVRPEMTLWQNNEEFIWLIASPVLIILFQDFFVFNVLIRNLFLIHIGEKFFWIVGCYYSIYVLMNNYEIQVTLWNFPLIVLLSYFLSDCLYRFFSSKKVSVGVLKDDNKKDSITVKGWSAIPIEHVEILADGMLIGEACTGMFRKDLFEKTGKKHMAFLWEGKIEENNDNGIEVKILFRNGNRITKHMDC